MDASREADEVLAQRAHVLMAPPPVQMQKAAEVELFDLCYDEVEGLTARLKTDVDLNLFNQACVDEADAVPEVVDVVEVD